MRINYAVFSILLIVCFSGCKDDDNEPSKEELLAGSSSKVWRLQSISNDGVQEHEVCKSTSERSLDNTYTFYRTGVVEFDNGDVNGDETCDAEGCCEDTKNLYGTWEFAGSNKNYLLAIIDGTSENGVKDDLPDEEWFNADIEKLTKSELILDLVGVTATFVPVD